jgi:hypothetical protein
MLGMYYLRRKQQVLRQLIRHVIIHRRKRALNNRAKHNIERVLRHKGLIGLRWFYEYRKNVRQDKLLWRAATTKHDFFSV